MTDKALYIYYAGEKREAYPNDIPALEETMRFKADNIKAHADPELFEAVADRLHDWQSYQDSHRGKWVKTGRSEWICSVCGRECDDKCMYVPRYRFCPWCGSKNTPSIK